MAAWSHTPIKGRLSRAGHTLVELLVVVAVIGVALGAAFVLYFTVLRSMVPSSVKHGGQVYAVAPSSMPLPAAVALNSVFLDRLGEAKAVYTFGGSHVGIGSSPLVASVKPLILTGLPAFAITTLPKDSRTFYQIYSGNLVMDSAADPEDFAVLMIGARNGVAAVIAAVRVAKTNFTVSDGTETTPYSLYTVSLWDCDTGAYAYTFAQVTAQTSALHFGAAHNWYRYSEGAGEYEEAPTTVAFPDPFVNTGRRGQATDIPAFSRFIYSLPISR